MTTRRPQQPSRSMMNYQLETQGANPRGQGEFRSQTSQGHPIQNQQGDWRMTAAPNQRMKENVPPPSSSTGDGAAGTSSSSVGPRPPRRENGFSNTRVFSCRVSKMKEWSNLSLVKAPVVYRIHGRFLNFVTETNPKGQSKKKTLIIEDIVDSSQKMQCFFQEIDRELESAKVGDFVVAVGRLLGSKEHCSFQVLSLDVFLYYHANNNFPFNLAI